MSLQTRRNKILQSIPYSCCCFFFSSREWLDVTAEGFELCSAKREDTLKFVHETGHPALSAPNRHPCSTTEWVVQACSDSEQKSAHKGRAAWAVKKQQNETTFYSWNFNFIWKKWKKKKKEHFIWHNFCCCNFFSRSGKRKALCSGSGQEVVSKFLESEIAFYLKLMRSQNLENIFLNISQSTPVMKWFHAAM